MAIRSESPPFIRLHPAIAAEFILVTGMLIGLFGWQQLQSEIMTVAFGPQPRFGEILADGLASGGLFIAGTAGFAATYAAYREIDIGLALPSRSDLPLIGMAGVLPVLLAGLTKLVGTLTNVPYNSLTNTAYAADATAMPVILVAGLGIAIGVSTLVLVCQVLVQGSFRQTVEADTAVVLTTLVTGFVMVSSTGGLVAVPNVGKLAGSALFALTLGAGLFASEKITNERCRALVFVPVLLLVGLVVLSGIAAIDSIPAGLFAATQFAVLGIAALTYERTGSLLAPAVAYTSLMVANMAIVSVFEAGLQGW